MQPVTSIKVNGNAENLRVKTLFKSLLLHPQRTLDLEYQYGGDDFVQNSILNARPSFTQINEHDQLLTTPPAGKQISGKTNLIS